MSILAAPRPLVKSTRPARVFGEGLIEPTPTWPPSVEEARAWHADRRARQEAEAQTVTKRQLDEAWKLGNDLGRDGIEAFAPQATFAERVAFRAGHDA